MEAEMWLNFPATCVVEPTCHTYETMWRDASYRYRCVVILFVTAIMYINYFVWTIQVTKAFATSDHFTENN